MSLGSRIREERKKRRLTQADVAKHFKVTTGAVGNWEIDANVPDPDKLPELAKLLRVSIDYLMTGVKPQNPVIDDTNVSEPMEPANIVRFPRVNDVRIVGSALGGREDQFVISDEQIGFARRLPGAMGKQKVYCLYVQGDSVSPWRESGDLIYVDPDRPAAIGDYVVVQLKQDKEGDHRVAFVKRLIARTASKIRLLQYNPRKEIDIPTDRIGAIHRVMPWEELLEI